MLILATHLLGAVGGYGSTLLCLPLLLFVWPSVALAVQVLVIAGLAQAGQVLVVNVRHVDRRQLAAILLLSAPGLAAGLLVGQDAPRWAMSCLLAALLIQTGVRALRARALRPPTRAWSVGMLVSSGLVHGMFAGGGAVLVLYAHRALPDKNAFRATLSAVWVALGGLMLLSWLAGKRIELGAPWRGLVAIPFALAGTWIGEAVARRASQPQFAKINAVLLLAAGVAMLGRVAQQMGGG